MSYNRTLNEAALDFAARESYAVRCRTEGPRLLRQYASDEIMQRQLNDARIIVDAYFRAIEEGIAAP